eukprot:TRINITY_DN64379_c0_g1_i1.p1 TRINITY_DN64379_c0_g1~~TRINITY_DN64379_c0_g1_i1.p1  ORF type:complete len:538 (+),score=31.21 TRINITY_DN64379_c0_g1_i1:203-1615(+)
MYSVGEACGGLLCGKLYARFPEHVKVLLLSSMLMGFVAAASFTAARMFGDGAGSYVVVFSRFFSGFDNGSRQTIEQTYIGTWVPAKYQTTVSSRLGSFAISGIMLGPALGAPLQTLDLTIPVINLVLDGNNAPGLMLCLFCLMNAGVSTLYFHPAVVCTKHDVPSSSSVSVEDLRRRAPAPIKVGLGMCYAVFSLVNLTTASLETMTPIVAQRLYGWGPCLIPSRCDFRVEQAYVNLMLTCGGIASLTMSVAMACFLGRFLYGKEAGAILFGLCVYTCTNLENIDFGGSLPSWRFVSSYLVGAFLGALMRGPNISLLSQIVGPHDKAPYMGLLFAFGALPRIIGPWLLVEMLVFPVPSRDVSFPYVYDGPLPRTWLLYGGQAAIFFISALLVARARGPIRKHLDILHASESICEPLLGDHCGDGSFRDESLALPVSPTSVQEGIGGLFPAITRVASTVSSASTSMVHDTV